MVESWYGLTKTTMLASHVILYGSSIVVLRVCVCVCVHTFMTYIVMKEECYLSMETLSHVDKKKYTNKWYVSVTVDLNYKFY